VYKEEVEILDWTQKMTKKERSSYSIGGLNMRRVKYAKFLIGIWAHDVTETNILDPCLKGTSDASKYSIGQWRTSNEKIKALPSIHPLFPYDPT
jgi:hypothetical protein